MRPSTTRAIGFALTSIVWPALFLVAGLIWPGPVKPVAFGSPAFIAGTPSTLPPVDQSGSTVKLVITYDPADSSTTVAIEGQAPASRIFWDIPVPDSVPRIDPSSP
jgi:hypothetical protein